MASRRAARLVLRGAGVSSQLPAAATAPPASQVGRICFAADRCSPLSTAQSSFREDKAAISSAITTSSGRDSYRGASHTCGESAGLRAWSSSCPPGVAGDAGGRRSFHSGRILCRAAGAESSAVLAVQTSSEFNSVISDSPASQLVVVDFTANWCQPCQRIAPFLDELSTKHSTVTFLKVDIDKPELQDVVEEAKVNAVPTFQFYKAGKQLATFSGADRNQLLAIVERLSES